MKGAIYVGRRIVFAGLLLLIVSFLVFGLQSLSKDSIIATALGSRPPTPEQVALIRSEYNLDDPFLVRYGTWVWHAAQFDFGQSVKSGQPVSAAIVDRLPITLQLVAISILIVLAIGLPLGMIAGLRRGSLVDRIISTTSIVGFSAPVFALGVALLYVFGVQLGWFPVYGAGEGGLDRLHHLFLPALATAIGLTAIVARQTRAVTLNVMQEDYVTFARARGLSPTRILVRYALRNVAMPVVTITGLLLISLIGGTILVEQVFSIQGLGKLMVSSVQSADFPVVQGIALVFAIFVVIVTLLVDVIGMWIDPRTMYPAED